MVEEWGRWRTGFVCSQCYFLSYSWSLAHCVLGGISTASTRLCQDRREKRGKFIISGFRFPLQAVACLLVLLCCLKLPSYLYWGLP